MADYTIRLCDLVKSGYDVIGKALSSYPVDDESYRETLNKAILRHYWYNEIGLETADMFSWALDKAMNEIMPYYNERRAIDMLDLGIDPLMSYQDVRSTVFDRSSNGKRNAKVTNSEENENTRTDNFSTTQNIDGRTHTVGNDTRTDDLTETNSGTASDTGTTSTTRTDNLTATTTGSSTDGGNVTDTRTDNTNSETTNNDSSTRESSSNNGSNTTIDGYNKNYGIPTVGGSSGNGPGGFSDDFATSGEVNHSESDTTDTGSTNEESTSNGSSTTTNTGTVKNESVRNLTGSNESETKNTGTVNSEDTRNLQSETSGTRSNTGTVKNDATSDITTSQETTGTNNGTSSLTGTSTGTRSDDESTENTENGSTTEQHYGYGEAKFELLRKYREVIENITMMIVHDREIQNCFMGVLGSVGSRW